MDQGLREALGLRFVGRDGGVGLAEVLVQVGCDGEARGWGVRRPRARRV